LSTVRRLFRGRSGRIRLVWRLLLFAVTVVLVGGVLGGLLPQGLVWGGLVTLVAALAAGAGLLVLEGERPGGLGFHLARSVPGEAGRGIALGVSLAVLVALAMAASGAVRWRGDEGTAWAWMAEGVVFAAILALPAAAEEALLRGYPLQALSEVWGPGWALAGTSALFGAGHLLNPGVTPLATANVAAAGVFLGVIYLRTGSLWWASGAHLGWNWGTGFLADLPVSGLEIVDAPLVAAVTRGPSWLGGGPFGPEGSVLATLGFLGAAAVCWWGRWPRPEEAALSRKPLAFRRAADVDEPTAQGPWDNLQDRSP
jgi:membrane protease YdiL (CAAX protease family)